LQIKLTIEYDGTNYCGWQLQSGQDSIQAGRTDAGVHARGQVAAFTLPRPFEAAELHRALNAILPDDVVILRAEAAGDDFDPRRHATSRIYEYRVLNQQTRSAFEHRYSWLIREPLDLEQMNEAARVFLGTHDFAAFRTLGTEVKSTVRRMLVSEWRRESAHLIYRVEATSFLRHMVRTMVATMVEVGRGKLNAAFVAQLLERRERSMAPAAAPPQGLFLVEVRYAPADKTDRSK
jgi:tRNA pseudouridine38-40 synthase